MSATIAIPEAAGEAREVSFDTPETESIELPEARSRAGRGILSGVVLGAGLWMGILVLAGVIKL